MDEKLKAMGPDMFLSNKSNITELREQLARVAIDEYLNGGGTEQLGNNLEQISKLENASEPAHWLN